MGVNFAVLHSCWGYTGADDKLGQTPLQHLHKMIKQIIRLNTFCCTSQQLGVNFAVLHYSWGSIFAVIHYSWVRSFVTVGGKFCCTTFAVLHYSLGLISGISLQLGTNIRFFAIVGGQHCCTSLQLEIDVRYFTTVGDNFVLLHHR